MADNRLGKILYTEEQITNRAKEIAAQIDKDFEGEEVILLCTLKGSILWIGDIMKNLTVKTKLDFISASSYGASKTSSGVVKIKFDPEINMYNANVIVVEDIVDTGATMKQMVESLGTRNPASIDICTLFVKPDKLKEPLDIKYAAFSIPNDFIVG